MKTHSKLPVLLAFCAFSACTGDSAKKEKASQPTPEEVRSIAKEAYVYGFPLVDSYRVQYAYFVDKNNPEYKGPYNELHGEARVFTPQDKTIQTPNSDTPYGAAGLDLRAEPVVITLPAVDSNRYLSVQFVDAYTHNFAYLGTRTTGIGGGSYLVAGPDWNGEKPAGINDVIRSETQFAFAVIRTQLFGPSDLENVKKLMAQYKAQPLSAFLGQAAPSAAETVNFIKPLTPAGQKNALEFFNILNFVLKYCPTHPSEKDLMERFAKIGVGAGLTIDTAALKPEIKTAMMQGIADAWEVYAGVEKSMDEGKVTSGDMFGSREFLKNNYAYRMTAAKRGIYGNSKEEAMYPFYTVDADGKPLTGENKYTVRLAPGQFPPVNAFWSLTMYGMPASLLVENPINRYLINAPMLPQLKKDADGGVTLYIQHASPGKAKESNWLPAPAGPFAVVLRLYLPKPEAVDGRWKAPPMVKM